MIDLNHVREIVECITGAADELLDKGKDNLNFVEQGQLIAYAESLCIIRDALAGYDLQEVSLDFDIDTRYLS
ncbi:MAG: hypothetical protein ACI3V1_06830 [Faecousia sp.]